ncbi:glycosyltransferase family 4 protein [Parahaliea sp. F7430]|uniref:Glycosyltransferase family 4 protein n=2 Tax=Sediminihaliea albiluteola TaxID=2758564 RepID=A0A7W2TTA5_9GAMM|nr:glycosyltransferase family 4 protein [Sediminihaliea albiluteola]
MMREVVSGLACYSDVTVIGPRGCADYLPENVFSIETSPHLSGFLLSSTIQALYLCRSKSFNIIIGGSGLTGPSLALLQRVFKVQTAIFLHGLDLVAPSWVYQKIFIPLIRRANRVLANSHNTANLARDRGVPDGKITVINPGCHPADPLAHQRVSSFREEYDLEGRPIILFVGRMTRRKGLSQFIKHSLPGIFKSVPEAALLVVGDEPSNSLDQRGEKQAVIDSLGKLTSEHRQRVRFLGQVSDDVLNTCYFAANVHVFPILNIPGDVEGFGMVVIEAASYGTPTVAFDVGGVADAIGGDGGLLVDEGDYHDLSTKLVDLLLSPTDWEERCRKHASQFSWERFNRELSSQLIYDTDT